MTSYQKSDSSIDANLLEEHSCQISSRSDLKRRSRFFEEYRRNNKNKNNKNNKMSNDVGLPVCLKKTHVRVFFDSFCFGAFCG